MQNRRARLIASQASRGLEFDTDGGHGHGKHHGATVMPAGRRRNKLVSDIESMLRAAFEGRILPFDSEAAVAYADIASARRAAGRPVPTADCQIAAIARRRGMAVATRNVRDFVDMGIDVIDPWTHL